MKNVIIFVLIIGIVIVGLMGCTLGVLNNVHEKPESTASHSRTEDEALEVRKEILSWYLLNNMLFVNQPEKYGWN